MNFVPHLPTILSCRDLGFLFSVTSSLILKGCYHISPNHVHFRLSKPSSFSLSLQGKCTMPSYPDHPLMNFLQRISILLVLEAQSCTKYFGNIFLSGSSSLFQQGWGMELPASLYNDGGKKVRKADVICHCYK